MTDDAFDPSTPSPELSAVAAALDGTATPAEQALVDGSPRLQEMLAELADDRSAIADLADVEITTEVREWSIAAALGAYDEMLAGATPVMAAASVVSPAGGATAAGRDGTVLSFERRRRTYRALMGAAAAVVVVLVGVAVFGGRGSDLDSAETPMAATAKSEANADSTRAATSAAGGVLDQAAPTADTTASSTAEATAAGAADTSAPQATTAYTIGTGGATVGTDLRTPQDLAAYAVGKQAMTSPEQPVACVAEGAEMLGSVTYQGVPAVVTRDPATGQVTAFDLADCSTLAVAGP